jgi:hypothetical protein
MKSSVRALAPARACGVALALLVAGCSSPVEHGLQSYLEENPVVAPVLAESVKCVAPVSGQPQQCTVSFMGKLDVPPVTVRLPPLEVPFAAAFEFRHRAVWNGNGGTRYSVEVHTDFDGRTVEQRVAAPALARTVDAAYQAAVVQIGDTFEKKVRLLKNLESYN